MMSSRAYYSAPVAEFLKQSSEQILGNLSDQSAFDVTLGQIEAWRYQIAHLKGALRIVDEGHILLEYTIPRMGKRIDAVLLFSGVVVVLEFKVGSSSFDRHANDQVTDYALDLKYFHAESHQRAIVPILVATHASQSVKSLIRWSDDMVAETLCLAMTDLERHLVELSRIQSTPPLVPNDWISSIYRPTPTIIQAAQVLFREHRVDDISRNDASAINLERTVKYLGDIIDTAKQTRTKHVCLVTGVPGAGKTLAGLAMANSRQRFEEQEHAVFLSGNGPLVLVLQEALARDQHARGLSPSKAESLRRAKSFIQAIHHFRDDAVSHNEPPHEKVTIFDEAQRAWDSDQLSKFMKNKRGLSDFDLSEPEFLLEVMDRHEDWAVVVCLVGEGQEIHTGEAGISSWLNALMDRFEDWHVHTSSRIHADSYARGVDVRKLFQSIGDTRVHYNDSLHLSVSVRSFRSEKLSSFVEALLENQPDEAKTLLSEISDVFPIRITRDLERARTWITERARGSERYGLIATSGAKRLRPHGIWVDYRNDPREWFLNDKSDIRSSFGLEIAATEFDVQGLEIDWSIVAWDGDFRFNGRSFEHWAFRGKSWERVKQAERQLYLKNAYRVLLTRSRQGMILFIPHGDASDPTRPHEYYDSTFDYLISIGIQEV